MYLEGLVVPKDEQRAVNYLYLARWDHGAVLALDLNGQMVAEEDEQLTAWYYQLTDPQRDVWVKTLLNIIDKRVRSTFATKHGVDVAKAQSRNHTALAEAIVSFNEQKPDLPVRITANTSNFPGSGSMLNLLNGPFKTQRKRG